MDEFLMNSGDLWVFRKIIEREVWGLRRRERGHKLARVRARLLELL
jgi:hypothetical protein